MKEERIVLDLRTISDEILKELQENIEKEQRRRRLYDFDAKMSDLFGILEDICEDEFLRFRPALEYDDGVIDFEDLLHDLKKQYEITRTAI